MRQLHSYGLLRGSFRPDAEIAALCAYLRQRERLVEYASRVFDLNGEARMARTNQISAIIAPT
jgi:transposase